MGAPELNSLIAWLRDAPTGTTVDAAVIAARLERWTGFPDAASVDTAEPTWREKLWTAPAESRIGRDELLEAVGRPASWLYRHTSQEGDCARIPHRKMDGELVFVVGEVRKWLVDHEEVIVKGSTTQLTLPLKRRSSGYASGG